MLQKIETCVKSTGAIIFELPETLPKEVNSDKIFLLKILIHYVERFGTVSVKNALNVHTPHVIL